MSATGVRLHHARTKEIGWAYQRFVRIVRRYRFHGFQCFQATNDSAKHSVLAVEVLSRLVQKEAEGYLSAKGTKSANRARENTRYLRVSSHSPVRGNVREKAQYTAVVHSQ